MHIPGSGEDLNDFMKAFETMYGPVASVTCEADKVGVQRYDDGETAYVHVLNYRYSEEKDKVEEVPKLTVRVKGAAGRQLSIVTPPNCGMPDADTCIDGEDLIVKLKHVGLYTVLKLVS